MVREGVSAGVVTQLSVPPGPLVQQVGNSVPVPKRAEVGNAAAQQGHGFQCLLQPPYSYIGVAESACTMDD